MSAVSSPIQFAMAATNYSTCCSRKDQDVQDEGVTSAHLRLKALTEYLTVAYPGSFHKSLRGR